LIILTLFGGESELWSSSLCKVNLFILVRHTSQYYRMIWLHRPVWLKCIYIYDAFTCLGHLMTVFRRPRKLLLHKIIVLQVQSCPKFIVKHHIDTHLSHTGRCSQIIL
jgi:hypothetical protein